MNKLKILLIGASSALLLAACGGPVSSSNELKDSSSSSDAQKELNPETLLKGLQKGFKIAYTLHSSEVWPSSDPIEKDEVFSLASQKDYTQFKQWEGKAAEDGSIQKGSLEYNTTYTHALEGEKDVLQSVSLGIDNVVHKETVKDSSGDAYLWGVYGMQNAFELMDASVFQAIDGGFAIDFTKTPVKAKRNLAAMLYGYYYAELDSFEIHVKENAPVSFNVSFKEVTEDIMGSTVKTTIAGKGQFSLFDNADSVTGIKPLEGEEDATFAKAMKDLQAYNWQESFELYQGKSLTDETLVKSSSALVKANPDQFVFTSYYKDGSVNYDQGHYALSDGKVQEVNRLGGVYYKNGEAKSLAFPKDFLPTFKMSSLFFDKEGNTYTLNHDRFSTGYSQSYIFATLYGGEVTDLTITIDNGKVTFENVIPAGEHTVLTKNVSTYEAIGSTASPLIDVSAVKDTTEGLSFSEVFKASKAYADLLQIVGSEALLNEVPSTEDNHSNISLYADAATSKAQIQIKVTQDDDEEGKALATSYGKILAKHGFSTPAEDEDGNMTATKKVGEETLSVSYYFDDWDYYLVIMPKRVTAA